jgi:hypothetical protein
LQTDTEPLNISGQITGEPALTDDLKASALRELFKEYMVHARHLESYLMSFTQVFLLITGALWGFALLRLQPLLSLQAGSSSSPVQQEIVANTSEGPWFIVAVLSFHLFYSFVGMIIVVRSSVNFRKNWDMAHKALKDAGFGDYMVRVFPENSEGKLKVSGFFKQWQLLLMAKTFFLLLYAGAAGVDGYFVLAVLPQAQGLSLADRICISGALILVLIILSYLFYRIISREMPLNSRTQEGGRAGGETPGTSATEC